MDHPQNNRPALLSLSQVTKTFGGGTVALRGMDLTLREGDFLSLLGPSGCGKSTALRMIAGLMSPTRGRIDWTDARRSGDLGVVFQEPTLMPWATVAQNVWLPLRLQGKSYAEVKDDVLQALKLVGLEQFQRSYPRELSGGMKMRVSIARAMVTKPRLILMDEPFAALDEITRFKLNDDLLKMKGRTKSTVMFVTHSVMESVYLSDRIIVMAARPGRVVEEISVSEPYPRDESFRTEPAYSEAVRRASAALHVAMEDAA